MRIAAVDVAVDGKARKVSPVALNRAGLIADIRLSERPSHAGNRKR
jgi:hypothetical protein